jgi:hypothetical protein
MVYSIREIAFNTLAGVEETQTDAQCKLYLYYSIVLRRCYTETGDLS